LKNIQRHILKIIKQSNRMNNLFESYQATKDPLIKQQIILKYTNLIHYVIHKIKFRETQLINKDDAFSFGVEGLNKAIEKYIPDYDYPFKAFATLFIHRAIVDACKKHKDFDAQFNKLKDDEIKEPFYCDINETAKSYLPLPSDFTTNNELKTALQNAISTLPDRSQVATKLYFFNTLTQEDIADLLGVSRRLISHIIDKSLRQLRKDKRLKELWRGEEDRKQP
jgi:RNA polymerase sigma factor (sigma-70 family)